MGICNGKGVWVGKMCNVGTRCNGKMSNAKGGWVGSGTMGTMGARLRRNKARSEKKEKFLIATTTERM